MNLDEAQKQKVSGWIREGLKLSDIQKRLSSELGLNLTYMEVRFLVDDLKLTPKDIEPTRPAELGVQGAPPAGAKPPAPAPSKSPRQPEPAARGSVTVGVDTIARPGSVVSGNVTFSDGAQAEWYLDEMGRLGLVPKQQGYRPSPADVNTFQNELQNQLAKLGF